MIYPVGSQLEFYRTRELEIETADYEMHLLSHLPSEEVAWYCELLLVVGDLLISGGTQLKNSVRPSSTSFSREIQ